MTSQPDSGTPGSATAAPQGSKSGPNRRAAEIGVDEARKAFFLMVGLIALIWILQIANWADHYRLDDSYGILPHSIGHLPDIFAAPFLHFSWEHVEGNSGPLFVFGLLAAYRGVVRFLGVTLLVIVTSGAAAWLFQSPNQLTVGASGLVFGYFGYVLTRGVVDRNPIDVVAALVLALSYAYILMAAIPGTPGVSWTGHLGGLAGGLAAGWIFRTRRGLLRRGRTELSGDPGDGSPQSMVTVPVGQGHPRRPAQGTGRHRRVGAPAWPSGIGAREGTPDGADQHGSLAAATSDASSPRLPPEFSNGIS